jgi:N6-adenosine-specific RNA methylase IME4
MRYHIIYADPPWKYNARKKTNTKFGGGAMGHYPCMTLKEIKNIEVSKITEQNCALFLWTTFPKLQESLDVIKEWGFTYKTLAFSWHKLNQDGSLFFGVGSYTKSNCEVCLFATKGSVGILKKGEKIPDSKEKLVVRSNFVSSAINAKRSRHSKKPDEIRDRIVELFGDVSRIELFARKESDGWDVWGNETDSDIEIGL